MAPHVLYLSAATLLGDPMAHTNAERVCLLDCGYDLFVRIDWQRATPTVQTMNALQSRNCQANILVDPRENVTPQTSGSILAIHPCFGPCVCVSTWTVLGPVLLTKSWLHRAAEDQNQWQWKQRCIGINGQLCNEKSRRATWPARTDMAMPSCCISHGKIKQKHEN